jgi:hypothetical protein
MRRAWNKIRHCLSDQVPITTDIIGLRHQKLPSGSFHEFFAVLLGLVELGFEFVAQGHELIDFVDDAFLFFEGGRENGFPAK